MNGERRHLSESQRAMIGAKLANRQQGRPAKEEKGANLPLLPNTTTLEDAAQLLNVSERSIKNAKVVRDHGIPDLVEKVERDEIAVSAAADVARAPAPEQREIVAKGEREILEAAKRIRAERADQRRQENDALRASTATEVPAGIFSTIVIDPPLAAAALVRGRIALPFRG
jgi:hypothetical protein